MGDFSVKAILSAVDKNFSSTMKGALGYTNNLKDTLTSGIGFGAMMAIGQTAVSTVTNKMSSLSKETIETSDSMYKLQAAMRFSGYAEDEIQRIAGATGSLKTYADKTVFSLQDVMSTFGALSANGIKDADKLTEAVGNAVAVFGGGAQEYSSVALAFSQAMAAGSLHAQDWNQILNASPQLAGGLRKELIRLNPVLGEDFKGAMEEGVITADLLAEAMNSIGMTDMAKEAATSVTTFEGAMGNLEATAVSGMMNLYDTFAKSSVIDAINGLNDKVGAGFDWLATKIPGAITRVKPYFYILKNAAIELKDAFGPALSAVKEEIGKLTGSLNDSGNIATFWGVVSSGTSILKTFAGFMEEHADVIAKVITVLPKLIIAYKGFKIVKAVAPFVGMFTGAIGGLAKLGLSKLVPNLFGVAKGQDKVGKSSGSSSKKMLASAKAFMMIGVGVLTICAGFYLLAQSAVAVANAGPLAVGVLAGLVITVSALSIGMLKMLSSMKGGTKKLSAMSTAMVALGASILLISAGLWILSNAAVNLANAGPLAVGAMFGMVVAIGALLLVAKSVAPALTAGAVGFVAFGAAVILAGVGMILLSNAAISLANAGSLAIGVMVGMVAAVALLAAGAALLGPALTAGAVGLLAFGAAVLFAGAGIALIGAGAMLASVALQNVVAVLPFLTAYGTQSATTLMSLGTSLLVFGAGALVAGEAALLLGAGMVLLGTGLILTGLGSRTAATGLALLQGVLPLIEQMCASSALQLAAFGAALLVFGAGALIAGAGALILGAGLIVVGSGAPIAAKGLILLSGILPSITEICASGAGPIALLGASFIVFGTGALFAGAGALVLALGLIAAGGSARIAASGFILFGVVMPQFAEMCMSSAVQLAAFGAALLVFGASALIAVTGILAFGAGMIVASAGTLVLAVALIAVNSSMKSIASNAKNAKKSLTSMVESVDIVNSGLDALGSKAKSAMKSLINAFDDTTSKVQNSGKEVGNGFNNGMQNGLSKLPVVVIACMTGFNSALSSGCALAVSVSNRTSASIVSSFRSASSGAYSCGCYIGQGLANGMLSTLGLVKSAAAQLASAADEAIQAKAKIGSPSKVQEENGEWFGQGLANGILNKVKTVKKAADKLMFIPKRSQPQRSLAGYGDSGYLSDDYEYYRNEKYTIIVPLQAEGREIARASATYTQEELEKKEKLNKYLKGNR